MRQAFVLVMLLGGSALAQPAPDAPAPPDAPKPQEKPGKDESLQNGGVERPWAKGVAPQEQKAALAIFQKGNDQLNEGLFAKAAENYREALKHWDHPAIHYNLALALMNVDQPIEAYENMVQSTKFGEAPLQSKDKFDHAKEYIVLLEKQIADVDVSCDKAGAKVSVDGKEVFIAPGRYQGRVRVGKHTFICEKQGYNARVKAPYIGPGDHFRIEMKLYTADELTRYHRRWQATWLPYAIAGGGLALGIAGALLEKSATSSYDDYDAKVAACNQMTGNNGGCTNSSSLSSIRSSGDTKKNLGIVMYGAAGAAIAGGVVLYMLNRPQAYQVRPEDLQHDIAIAPVVAPDYAGAVVAGRF